MSGISLDITTEEWNTDDKSWLKHQLGFDTARPCTLDLSLFTADHKINGFIPSGTAVGKVTATGLYGPYTTAAADGTETAAGLLLNGVRTNRGDDVGQILKSASQFIWQGIVNFAKLPPTTGPAGKLDAAGRTDLPGIRFENVT